MNKDYEDYLRKRAEKKAQQGIDKEIEVNSVNIDNSVNKIDNIVNEINPPKKSIVNKTKDKSNSVNKIGRKPKYDEPTKLLAIRVPVSKYEALLNLLKDNL